MPPRECKDTDAHLVILAKTHVGALRFLQRSRCLLLRGSALQPPSPFLPPRRNKLISWVKPRVPDRPWHRLPLEIQLQILPLCDDLCILSQKQRKNIIEYANSWATLSLRTLSSCPVVSTEMPPGIVRTMIRDCEQAEWLARVGCSSFEPYRSWEGEQLSFWLKHDRPARLRHGF